MTFDEARSYFGKRVEIVTRPIAPSSDEGHFEGVLEQIDNDPRRTTGTDREQKRTPFP